MRFLLAGIGAVGVFLGGTAQASDILLSQTFGSTQVGTFLGDTPSPDLRFDFAAAGVTAHYNSAAGNAWLVLPLSNSLSQNQSFRFTTTFVVHAADFYADPKGFAQMSFGLLNSNTTGFDRTGWTFSNSDDPYDSISVDYFPNISVAGESPSFNVNAIGSKTPGSSAWYDTTVFPPQQEAGLSAEGDLPRDVTLTAQVIYDSSTHVFSLTLADGGGPRTMNTDGPGTGAYDSDSTTIQTVATGLDFNVDSFAIMLWEDPYRIYSENYIGDDFATVRGDITFTSVEVEALPEPASLSLLGGAALMLLRRRR